VSSASDERLAAWLELARSALQAAPAERLAGAEQLFERRAALLASLEARPPAPPAGAALCAELAASDALLHEQLAQALAGLREQLEAVRAQRQAHAGYRPARPTAPAYVSRQA
jgi:hypothetical protein